ncbi:hypothetical protein K503DRAFT_869694 [Rhizopogon vinicolor AM-OR11-026]|uniref:Uncharacterized protein n=1 Tax=Rhizopogon vinicolor AM-OR11-026 TaxID=1314800 RepID=A0A1B7MKU4_9AGAM|nr:hypothetical protein K503DRAFT_869694 [Rhizopogon vinicolor AM-OR11-026]
MDTFTIADLRKDDVAKQFGTISTLYIPPRDERHANFSMAKAFGSPGVPVQLDCSVKWAGPKLTIVSANGPYEHEVIAQIDAHVAPEGHTKLHMSAAMRKFMTDLALKPKLLEEYKLDPVAVVESAEGLSNLEQFGLKFGTDGPAGALMTATESDIVSGRQLTEEEIAKANGPLRLQFIFLIVELVTSPHMLRESSMKTLVPCLLQHTTYTKDFTSRMWESPCGTKSQV